MVSVYRLIDYLDWFLNIVSALLPGINIATLDLLIFWLLFCQCSQEIQVCNFFCIIFVQFWHQGNAGLTNALKNVPFSYIFWKRLCKMAMISSWHVLEIHWNDLCLGVCLSEKVFGWFCFVLFYYEFNFLFSYSSIQVIYWFSAYSLCVFCSSLLHCLLVHFLVFDFNLSLVFLNMYLCIMIFMVALGFSYIPKLPQFTILFQYFMTSRRM